MKEIGVKLSNWLFKLLFPKQWRHMRHLIDDVIYLEREKIELTNRIGPSSPKITMSSGCDNPTTTTEGNFLDGRLG